LRVAFVTNICAHYRVKTFEALARYHDVDYYFFSAGEEWYWQREHGVQVGEFECQYLPGVRLGGTRFVPTLAYELWRGGYDAYIKCINGRFALPITFLVARLRRKPFVLWTGIWMKLNTPAHRIFYPLTRYIYRHADAIVVYGEHTKRFLIGEGVAPERISVAAHAVDNNAYNREVSEEEKAALCQQLDLTASQRTVLFLGRLEEVKGLPYLLQAFSSLPLDGSVLVLAGTGSKQQEMEALAQELGIAERVRFAGYVPSQEAVVYYSLASLLVLPSITLAKSKELWGLVVNEAMNQGVPVVVTDAVGAAAGGLVQDGVNGYVVPERDSQALAEAMQRILDDAELRQRMGRAARQSVIGWDNERMVRGFREAIDYVTSA
jgi:glycosyltransferase involved in cell wall biosynthesis